MNVNALVLAGDSGAAALGDSPRNKGLVAIAGQPMIVYVLKALRDSGRIGRIAVIGHELELRGAVGHLADAFIEPGQSITDNLVLGVRTFASDPLLMVVTSDIPFLTPEAVRDFVDQCERRQAQAYYPICPREAVESSYPGARRTYFRLQEGQFTGGNVFMLSPKVVEPCVALLRKLEMNRKKPWKTGRLLGIRYLLRFLRGTLSISAAEVRAEQILGFPAAAVVSEYAGIGNDVDSPENLAMARRLLEAER